MSGSDEGRTVRVYEVLCDWTGEGSIDGMRTHRFRSADVAQDFARDKTCYGRTARARAYDAPVALARRWGLA